MHWHLRMQAEKDTIRVRQAPPIRVRAEHRTGEADELLLGGEP
jgi:hypothetical protein